MTTRKLLNLISTLLLVALLVLVAVGVTGYYTGVRPALTAETWIYIRPTDTRATLKAQLASAGVDSVSIFWTDAVMNYMQADRKFRNATMTGAYRLEAGTVPLDVARRLTRREQTPVSMTLHEARLPEQVAGRLTRRLMTDSLDLLNAMFDPATLTQWGLDSATVISLFLPDTYQVYWSISAADILRRMKSEHDKFWNETRRQQAASLGLTPVEVATLASIAEEETQDRQERGVVARLYWNRLQRGMPLQADPTVKFAIGDFSLRRVLHEHLTANSPYNTYLHAGLPPGPIRCPQKATMDALLNSEPHDYLYMCAKEDFSGRHNFARTLSEHNANAARYHRALSNLLRSAK